MVYIKNHIFDYCFTLFTQCENIIKTKKDIFKQGALVEY